MWGVCAGVRRACDAEQEVASGLGWARLGGVCSAERWSTSCCLSESSEHRREKPQQQNVAQSSTQTSISNSFSINTHSGADSGAGGLTRPVYSPLNHYEASCLPHTGRCIPADRIQVSAASCGLSAWTQASSVAWRRALTPHTYIWSSGLLS